MGINIEERNIIEGKGGPYFIRVSKECFTGEAPSKPRPERRERASQMPRVQHAR
jgi:hypothetical protein